MLSLRDRALKEGGDAVIDIHSVYKGDEFKSATEYECGAGTIMGGVARRGTVVKLHWALALPVQYRRPAVAPVMQKMFVLLSLLSSTLPAGYRYHPPIRRATVG